MGLYNVVGECVVDGKHFPGPHPEPVEVNDSVAAGLVKSGALEAVAQATEPDAEAPHRRGRQAPVEAPAEE
jgi:hypothetical protein